MIRALAVGLLCLSLSACTLAGARLTFVAGVAADAGTTQYGVTHGAREANPVISVAPLPIMLGVAAVTVYLAERAAVNGDTELARKLYLWAGACHGAFGLWNVAAMREAGP